MTYVHKLDMPKYVKETMATSGTGIGEEEESVERLTSIIAIKTACEWKGWRKPDQRRRIHKVLEKALRK